MQRYEELVTLRITENARIKTQLQKQGHVILALDGVPPDVGHEVHRARTGLSYGAKSCWPVPCSVVRKAI